MRRTTGTGRPAPVAVRLTASLGLLALLLGACGQDRPVPSPSAPAAPREADGYAAELVELTNETRAAEGLQPLADSTCAREAALDRAANLVGEEELVHAPLAPVIEQCAPHATAAENLVTSVAGPGDVVAAWLDSSGHRANLLDPALTEIGIGCVPDGSKLLCSQVFLGP